MSPLGGPRTGHDKQRLTPLTVERARIDPHPLAKRFTKFKQDFSAPIAPPRVIGPRRTKKHLEVGQIPED